MNNWLFPVGTRVYVDTNHKRLYGTIERYGMDLEDCKIWYLVQLDKPLKAKGHNRQVDSLTVLEHQVTEVH